MPRIYNTPPVIEALCEFRFKSSQPWDWTIPGLVYEKVRGQFPKKRQQNVLEVAMQPDENKVLPQMKTGVERMQFLNEEENALVQVGPDLLAVNHLPPYPKWDAFKTLILEQLTVYRNIANPEALTRIGLRYINRIEIPAKSIELEAYFHAFPRIPEPIPQAFPSFVLHVDVAYEKPSSVLRFILGSAPSETPEKLTFILDLDMVGSGENVPSMEQLGNWIEVAHEHVEAAFDASFTEKTHKEIFAEVPT
ncbi:MAG: TIGR04255 family protein [Deltaproteobacteria bacterium]|nr:TIGR04255 family protein [Deltaproteobacteria bacterium]